MTWKGESHKHSLASRGILVKESLVRRIIEDNPDDYEILRYTLYVKELKDEMKSEIINTRQVKTWGLPFDILSRDELFGDILDRAERDYGLNDSYVNRLDKYTNKLYKEYRSEIQ